MSDVGFGSDIRVVLNDTSHAYLKSLGLDNPDDWDTAADAAVAKLDATLASGAPIDPGDVLYIVDYIDSDTGAAAQFADWFNNTGYGRVNVYLNTLGLPITDALAPLFADEEAFQDLATRNKYLDKGLSNCNFHNIAPPAVAIAALGTTGGNIGATVSNLQTNRAKAETYAEGYLDYASSHHLPVSKDLVDAWVNLDPANATVKLSHILEDGLNWDGGVPPVELMDAYRALNPTGPSGISSVNARTDGYDFRPQLDPNFDPVPPVVQGWSYFAMWSLMKNVNKDQPLDPKMLQDLDGINPWAANYARYKALENQVPTGTLDPGYLAALNAYKPQAAAKVCEKVLMDQVAAHVSLNSAYLKIVAASDPEVAAGLCNMALQDAYQPTNGVLDPTGTVNPYNASASTTPTIRVDLNSMGTRPPAEGDQVQLRLADGSKTGTFRTLMSADISLGYVDIQTGQLPAGNNVITSSFTDGVGYTSPSSMPFTLWVDTAAPSMGTYYWSSGWNGNSLVMNIAEDGPGMADSTPAPGDFTVTVSDRNGGTRQVAVTAVTLDAVDKKVKLDFAERLDSASVNVSYTPGDHPLIDLAGDTVAAFNTANISGAPPAQPGYTGVPWADANWMAGVNASSLGLSGINSFFGGAAYQDLVASSDTGIRDYVTSEATPTIQVPFSGGLNFVNLYAADSVYGTKVLVGRRQVASSDWGAGYTLIQPQDYLQPLPPGVHFLWSETVDTSGASHMALIPTAVKVVPTGDTTAPDMASSFWNSGWNDHSLVMNVTENGVGLADATPSPDAFTVTSFRDGSVHTIDVDSVIVDAINKRVQLVLHDNPSGDVNVSYDPNLAGGNPLQDLAGNLVAGFNTTTNTPPIAGRPMLPPSGVPWAGEDWMGEFKAGSYWPPRARALDMNAWNVLNSIHPVLAKQWWNRFANAGLLPPSPPGSGTGTGLGTDPNGLDLNATDLTTLMYSVFMKRAQAAEDLLRQQIAIVQQKNVAIGKLNALLGELNKMAAAVPTKYGDSKTVDATTKLKDALGDKYTALTAEIKDAIVAAGIPVFNTKDGNIDDTITKGDLEGVVQEIKGKEDTLANNQQSEMLRLQSLMTARNEAFDMFNQLFHSETEERKRLIGNM